MRVAKSDRVKAASTLFRLLGAGVVAGLIVALIALPAVGSAGLTARDAANNFEDMEGELKTTPPSEKTVMYDASGKQVATFFDKYRESVRLDQVDPIMRKAIIDIEDSRFYEHGALDLKGTIRALASNVESEQTQGGSTLTQQYVKNLLVDSARTQEEYREATAPTVGRKLRELRYALDIEQRMTKDQILEGYLNIAYFGAGAYGVQAAAKRYFSVPASKLNLGQAALLAGITQNPAAFDPIRNPKDARHRRDIVLYRMAQLGHISKAQADEEAAKPIELNRTDPVGGCQSSKAPYFCEYVKYDMLNILSDGKYWELEPKQQQAVVNELNRGGYTIRTTLDMEDQRAVDKTLRSTVAPGGNRVGAEAMVEPGTGKVKAIGLSKRFGPGKGRTTINLPGRLPPRRRQWRVRGLDVQDLHAGRRHRPGHPGQHHDQLAADDHDRRLPAVPLHRDVPGQEGQERHDRRRHLDPLQRRRQREGQLQPQDRHLALGQHVLRPPGEARRRLQRRQDGREVRDEAGQRQPAPADRVPGPRRQRHRHGAPRRRLRRASPPAASTAPPSPSPRSSTPRARS
ncbi:transglycosylase domain-containing protein [Actinomadura madurae]|nr:transglycosylase domain-containing protein [Actinomadura madurae]MCQ0017775.1 transglycosylase domain-containing protein [Actinomadura madurae]